MSSIQQKRLFLSPPHLGRTEFDLVRAAFESNYIAPVGPMVDGFEREFAEYTGIPYCLALSSGTAAMHLALRELGVGPGDEVLASSLTFIGSVTPATCLGASVAFIDADEASWNMDPELLAAELAECARRGELPRAVIPTDLYGQCCDLQKIVAVCKHYDIPVVADAAEAMGAGYFEKAADGGQKAGGTMEKADTATPHPGAGHVDSLAPAHSALRASSGSSLPRAEKGISLVEAERAVARHSSLLNSQFHHAGSDAKAAVFSFNGNKIITTSGGGMLASHDERMIEHARKLSQQAREPAPHYEHTEIGYNYRLSNILAAIGRGQLRVLDERVAAKRRIFDAYVELLADTPGIDFMPEADGNIGNRWLSVILITPEEYGATPEDVRLALEEHNIESRPMWKPMHMQPVFAGCRVRGGKVSEDLFNRGLCLPSGTAMTDGDIDRVADIIRNQRGD